MTSPTVPCPSCASVNAAGSRFCSSCGQRIDVFSQAPTVVVHEPATPRVGRLISSDSVPVGGFAPGVILADRYRIIGLLGRGGMGEVYRADDLKLGQAVALKFLPPALADDPVRRERFFAEVRIARQLSHPNVCRVYDISEFEGRHFLSMEYIDGEDLASLLQRIGHFSNEKAVDIARQLVAGLSAAHERGVLHRDLKPSNVMLDGLGRVRITDFGLAIAADDEAQAADVSGTPAYMAPEQLAGKGATVRSDIYSLGLILYEIHTGKPAFRAASIAELREQKATRTPTAPSDLRPGVDPVVERLITRCLDREPGLRPASVAQVAAALPGGDALAAAIAAGETPSPDLLMASGSKEGLRPAFAIALLAFVVVGTLAAVVLIDRHGITRRANLTRPPDALVDRAQELIRTAGYTQTPADSASGFFVDQDAYRYAWDTQSDRADAFAAAGAVGFLYRESPRPLIDVSWLGSVGPGNPTMAFPGEVAVQLDGQGRLRTFGAVPRTDAGPSSPIDWSVLFVEAGLDIAQWMPADPQWTPPVFADTRVAWTGTLPYGRTYAARIEAASYRGRPVSFVVAGPWTPPASVREYAATPVVPAGTPVYQVFFVLVTVVVLVTSGALLARQNLRLGRGDKRGATRVMLFTLVTWTASWFAIEHHVADLGEVTLFAAFAGRCLPVVGLLWMAYIAVEPFFRRRWPHILVSWTRVLAGDWRDPLVGRDVLIGSAASIAFVDLLHAAGPSRAFSASLFDAFLFNSPRSFIGALSGQASAAVAFGLAELLLLLLFRLIMRRDSFAVLAWALVGLFPTFSAIGEISWVTVSFGLAWAALSVFVLFRVGLVAAVVSSFFSNLLARSPLTLDASTWYAGIGYSMLAVYAIVTLYGFRTALGGRPMMGTAGFEN